MINIEKIKEYTGADEAFIATLFKKFLRHLDEDLEEIRTEASAENWANARKKIHAMQSSARIFHLEEIVARSTEIESLVDDGNFDGLKDNINRLVALYVDLRAEVNAWMKIN